MISQSSSVQDTAQALDVAESLLNLRLKMTRSLTLTAAPNPALEAGTRSPSCSPTAAPRTT